MSSSRYFERTLFYDRSPAADEYYARSADNIFEKSLAESRVEVKIQTSIELSGYSKQEANTSKKSPLSGPSTRESEPSTLRGKAEETTRPLFSPSARFDNTVEDTRIVKEHDSESDDKSSLSSKASSTAFPAALDHHHGPGPPRYPGPPTLLTVDLDLKSLRRFAQVTSSNFRVFYLRQRTSHSRVQITRDVFEQLLNSCHAFPRFTEYMIGFGVKTAEVEVGPPPISYRLFSKPDAHIYHGLECSYILRYVELTNRIGGKFPWSLRQFAVYHRYKPAIGSNCSTWILVGASQRTEARLDLYTRSIEDLHGSNPFELHVIFIDTALSSWRPYLVDLARLVTKQSDKAAGVAIGQSGTEAVFISLQVEDYQELTLIEDRVADLILCLDSTLDTVTTFEEMYEDFCYHQGQQLGQGNPVRPHGDTMARAMRDKKREVLYSRRKAETLLLKVQNARALISSLLERQSDHNLQKLEQHSQAENKTMRILAEKNSRDSSSMRILTIITMIYLPCTIVSNFYSTQFVNQRELPSGATQLQYAENAWLFFAISVPLTLFTIFIWYCWVNSERLTQKLHEKIRQRDNPLSGPAVSFFSTTSSKLPRYRMRTEERK